MSHLTETVLWLVCSFVMLFCCIIHAIEQNWLVAVVYVMFFVFDISYGATEFSAWARKEGQKAVQKKENENDT